MIKFKKLLVEGFGSVPGPTKFKFNRPGLNVIIGAVGSGKTTFISALCWTLYGKSLKGKRVLMWKSRRPKDYKGVCNSITFSKGDKEYQVIRCEDYQGEVLGSKGKSRLILIEDGKESDIRDKKPLQAEINKILGYSQDLFLNSILFGQGLKRIIEESGPGKKKVFEEAFESGFIKEGKDKADKELKTLRPQYQDAYMSYKESHAQVDKLKSLISVIKEQEEDFEKQKSEKLSQLKTKSKNIQGKYDYAIQSTTGVSKKKLIKKIDALKVKISKIDADSIKDLENREFKQSNLVDNLELQVERLKTRIKTKTEDFKGIKKRCHYCGAKLSKEKVIDQTKAIKSEIAEIRGDIELKLEGIEQEKLNLGSLRKKLSSIKEDKSNLSELKSKLRSYELNLEAYQISSNNVNVYQQQLYELTEEINKIRIEKFPDKLKDLPKQLRGHKRARKVQKALYKGFEKDIKDLEWIISDALGNKGLRAYIFDTMLKGLNKKLEYYEQYIGYRVEFNVDLDSANKDIYTLCYIKDEIIDYEDLSGGQKKTVDICTAFSIHDLVSGDKPINLMVFDEVFDGLDAEHIDLVYELIREKSQDKAIFLITHNLELQNSSDKVIRMSLNEQGHTVLKTLSA